LHGVAAKGYVLNGIQPQLIKKANENFLVKLQNNITNKINKFAPQDADTQSIINALVLGNKSNMPNALQLLLQATGTSHLLAISGLHVGLIATFVYFFFFHFWRFLPRLCLYCPAPRAAALFSLATAFFYVALSGFSVSATRAFYMVALVTLMHIFNKRFHIIAIFILCILITMIIQPLALYDISFWLSYFAVFTIFYVTYFRWQNKKIMIYWKIQLGITFCMMPILFFYFQQTSTVGLIANFYAIPMVSFIILPLAFLASFMPINMVSVWLFKVVHYSIVLLITLLQYTAAIPMSIFHYAISNIWILSMSVLGILFIFAPKQLKLKIPGFILLLPMFYYMPGKLKTPAYRATVLDVGQGLSVVIKTQRHILVYDLGAIYPLGGSATQSVVIPYLRNQKSYHVDKLIISHQDSDHAGDIKLFLNAIKTDEVLTSAVQKFKALHVDACRAGQHWQWDGVDFEMLSPSIQPDIGSNEQSCVLRIDNGYGSVLLTGDMDKKIEQILIKKYDEHLHSTVLVAAHHGSNTASSSKFIQMVKPTDVIFSEGFLNRYHFPHPKVIQRFQENGVQMWQNSRCGAITIQFPSKKSTDIVCFRHLSPKFWYHNI